MEKRLIPLAVLAAFTALSACGEKNPVTDPTVNPGDNTEPETPSAVVTPSFAKGADISWVTEMENKGYGFYSSAGVPTECTALMKDLGCNAIRLRVWVDPYKGWSGKADVLALAAQAKEAALALMIDFHYSDFFADPGRQETPKAWEGLSLDALKQKVAEHTKDVLSALKAQGVTPKWVQVGNETTHGFLWPMGRAEENMQQYAGLTDAGYQMTQLLAAPDSE